MNNLLFVSCRFKILVCEFVCLRLTIIFLFLTRPITLKIICVYKNCCCELVVPLFVDEDFQTKKGLLSHMGY